MIGSVAKKTQVQGIGETLLKWGYEATGLSNGWAWFDIDGIVYSKDERTVMRNIEMMLDADYDCMEIIELRIVAMDGYYLWPCREGEECPSIVYDEGPIPSWIEANEEVPWEVLYDKGTKESGEPPTAAPAKSTPEWFKEFSYSTIDLVMPTFQTDFTKAIENP